MADEGQELPKQEFESKPQLNIVYIEDDPAIRSFFETMMQRRSGHTVTSFGSESEFNEYWDNIKEENYPDVVVSDMNLSADRGKQEGLGILSKVKATSKKIKTALVSAEVAVLEGRDLPDIDLRVAKPFSSIQLEKQLIQLIKEE